MLLLLASCNRLSSDSMNLKPPASISMAKISSFPHPRIENSAWSKSSSGSARNEGHFQSAYMVVAESKFNSENDRHRNLVPPIYASLPLDVACCNDCPFDSPRTIAGPLRCSARSTDLTDNQIAFMDYKELIQVLYILPRKSSLLLVTNIHTPCSLTICAAHV